MVYLPTFATKSGNVCVCVSIYAGSLYVVFMYTVHAGINTVYQPGHVGLHDLVSEFRGTVKYHSP